MEEKLNDISKSGDLEWKSQSSYVHRSSRYDWREEKTKLIAGEGENCDRKIWMSSKMSGETRMFLFFSPNIAPPVYSVPLFLQIWSIPSRFWRTVRLHLDKEEESRFEAEEKRIDGELEGGSKSGKLEPNMAIVFLLSPSPLQGTFTVHQDTFGGTTSISKV